MKKKKKKASVSFSLSSGMMKLSISTRTFTEGLFEGCSKRHLCTQVHEPSRTDIY